MYLNIYLGVKVNMVIMKQLHSELLLVSLSNYYRTNPMNINTIVDIVNGKSKLSLRLIDWYVTNYCKNKNVVYLLNKDKNSKYFNVYMNYRSQLKAFKKIQFDPFRRRDRITFYYGDDEKLYTTLGQLNFFRWALDNEVIKNLENNITLIEKELLLYNNKLDVDKCKQSSIKNMTTFNGNAHISFN